LTAAVPSDFRARLRSEGVLVGSFLTLGSPIVAELMAIAGFDWLVVDLEHGAGDEGDLIGQLHAVGRTATPILVRVEAIEQIRFLKALDRGAAGVLVPRIESPDDAARAVSYCRYSGLRGLARYNRCWHWGSAVRTWEEVDDEVVCAIQIETASALDRVDEIASIDGVDVLFVGPNDLGGALGLTGTLDNPEMKRRLEEVVRAAEAHGKIAGLMVGSLAHAEEYAALGFRFVACGSDGGLLVERASEVAAYLRPLKRPVVASAAV
jgi:2-dehydro-3-deoxyglucarate aldolase/4-hydroxy-2-oxoheptanedioate aldolase